MLRLRPLVFALAVLAAAPGCSGRPPGLPSPSGPIGAGPTATASPLPTATPRPRFHVAARPIGTSLQARMVASGSWRPGCPVDIEDLRLLTLSFWGFDRQTHIGTLIVNRDAARAVAGAMRTLFRARFPIRRMTPVDVYGASDDRSMAADNTSAFNCRRVPGSGAWSQHAYGRALDINPRENPEVTGDRVLPPNGRAFVDRTRRARGMIRPDGVVVRAFAAVGWSWGGDWNSLKDYQHFSANGN